MTASRSIIFFAPLLAACAASTEGVPAPKWSGEATSTALVWNGFDHEWGYNHRLNRLGNWVGPMSCDHGECSAELVHAAASGVGSDTAAWSASATAVRAPGVGFLAGSTTFEIHEGRAEGDYLEQVQTVTVPAAGLLDGRTQYHVLMNGYDLFALEDADMFQSMDLALGDARYDAVAGTVSFDVTLGLAVDCDAFECDGLWDVGSKLDQSVHYGARIMWLLVAADDEVDVTSETVADAYSWDSEPGTEIDRDDQAVSVRSRAPERVAAGTFTTALVALQQVSIELETEAHLLQVATGARLDHFDSATGETDLTVDLFFKNWNAQTQSLATSIATHGEAHTSATVAVLRFHEATTAPVQASGSVTWNADGAPATDESALDRAPVSFSMPTNRKL